MTGGLNIVLPAREPSASKNRLSPLLSDAARQALATTLFRHAIGFYRGNWPDVALTVVTDSAAFSAEAQTAGAHVLPDAGGGLNAAIDQATAYSTEEGFERQLIVHADIAALDVREVGQLIDAALAAPGLIIVPSAEDGGTNAMLEAPPGVIPHRYGAGSFELHRAAAATAGVPVTVLELPGLARDLDTVDDIRAYLATSPSGPVAEELARWNVE